MKRNILLTGVMSLVFTALFYKTSLSLNLFIFTLAVLGIYGWNGYLRNINIRTATVFTGTLISTVMVIINHSVLSVTVNIISLFLLAGIMCYPESKSILHSLGFSFTNLFASQLILLSNLNNADYNPARPKTIWKWFRIIFIPVIIIVLFIFLYKTANPFFDTHLKNVLQFIRNKILTMVSFPLLLTFILGIFISVFLVIFSPSESIKSFDRRSVTDLLRRRKIRRNFKLLGLLTEMKAAIFLLIFLNLLILTVNIIDINWVWINFEWNGEYLKQFVHEGTYLLILSILISIAIVLYYFRGNLNFIKNNSFLKILSYIWLIQNAVLTFSVGLRNYRYIETFALAYKRIGVIIFLVLTIIGLITVIYKIRNCKSSFYLFRVNTMALYIILIFMLLFNWDIIIARYNFNHYKTSFVHMEYLSSLSDKALPWLARSPGELEKIEKKQYDKFEFRSDYINSKTYYDIIQKRISAFNERWENKKFLEWNLADNHAYKKLNSVQKPE